MAGVDECPQESKRVVLGAESAEDDKCHLLELREEVEEMLDVVRKESKDWLELKGDTKRTFSENLGRLGFDNREEILMVVCNHIRFFGTMFEDQLQGGESMYGFTMYDTYGFGDLPLTILEDIEPFERMRKELYEKFNQELVNRIINTITQGKVVKYRILFQK